MNFEILDIIVHSQAMTDAPSAFEYSAGHRVLVQPPLLVCFHGDRSLPDNMPVRGKPIYQIVRFFLSPLTC